MRYHSPQTSLFCADIFATMKKREKHLVELGKQIYEMRKSKSLSQEQVAMQANIDRSYLGGIERGERNLTFLTLVKIASCFGCTVAELTKNIPHDTE